MQLSIKINMKFSTEVVERARILILNYSIANISLPSANNIVLRQNALEIVEDMRPFNWSKIPLWLERADDCEKKLVRRGIIDDRTATEYLDSIEPKYAPFLDAYNQMIARHQQELEDLQSSFP